MTEVESRSDPESVWEATPKKLTWNQFMELLAAHAKQEQFYISGVNDSQEKSFRIGHWGESLLIRMPTGGGKTLIALKVLWEALIEEKVAVYVVPHQALLYEKTYDLQEFYGEFAHVVQISGEVRPSRKTFQKYRGRLIIVATYEAFRSVLFLVQNRKYFSEAQNVFGAIVIDEAHKLDDPKRGPKLETLIYKIQEEHPQARLCLLSASFTEESAEQWSQRLGCAMIYKGAPRIFRYHEVKKVHTLRREYLQLLDKEERIALIRKASDERAELVSDILKKEFEKFGNKLARMESEAKDMGTVILRENGYRGGVLVDEEFWNHKILVFCRTRKAARELASTLNKIPAFVNAKKHMKIVTDTSSWDQYEVGFWCDYTHAGLKREEQAVIFNEFKDRRGFRILCCSPLLETGVNIKGIKLVIICDPEKYTARELEQMCGRARGSDAKVLFLVPDEPDEEAVNEERGKLVTILRECRSLLDRNLQQNRSDARLLILCGMDSFSRTLPEKIKIFVKHQFERRVDPEHFSCDYLHSALEPPEQRVIQDRFRSPGTRILCMTPRAFRGMSFPDLQRIIIVSPEEEEESFRLTSKVYERLKLKSRRGMDSAVSTNYVLRQNGYEPACVSSIRINGSKSELKNLRAPFPYDGTSIEVTVVPKKRLFSIASFIYRAEQMKWWSERGVLMYRQHTIQGELVNQALATTRDWTIGDRSKWIERPQVERALDEEILALMEGKLPALWGYYKREEVYRDRVELGEAKNGTVESIRPADIETIDSENLRIKGFNIEPVMSRVVPMHSKDLAAVRYQIILESLFRHQLSPRDIMERLVWFNWNRKSKRSLRVSRQELREILRKELGAKMLLVTWSGGKYRLTPIGERVVESGLPPLSAHRGLEALKTLEKSSRINTRKYWRFFAEEVARLKYPDSSGSDFFEYDADWLATKRQEVRKYILSFGLIRCGECKFYASCKKRGLTTRASKPCSKFQAKIDPGDREMYRRTAIWLATSMYSIYQAYLLYLVTKRKRASQYKFITKDDLPTFANHKHANRGLLRIVKMFRSDHQEGERKPPVRSRRKWVPRSQYADTIKRILAKRGEKGATIVEIQQLYPIFLEQMVPALRGLGFLGRFLGIRSGVIPWGIKVTTIRSVLSQILEGKISRAPDYRGQSYRPPFRYWLKKHTPPSEDVGRCGECQFYIEGTCKERQRPVARTEAPCSEFKLKTSHKPLLLHDFEVNPDGQVQCPNCGHWGTVLIPTFGEMTLCNHCRWLFRQTRQGRYVGRRVAKIPETAQFRRGEFLFVDRRRHYRQRLFVRKGERLVIDRTRRSGTYRVAIQGRPRVFYFLDEVKEVYLARKGGLGRTKVGGPRVRRLLHKYGAVIRQLTKKEIKALGKANATADDLRNRLYGLSESMQSTKAQDLVVAKILSNVHFTLQMGNLLGVHAGGISPAQIKTAALGQLDHLLATAFLLQDHIKPIVDETQEKREAKARAGWFKFIFGECSYKELKKEWDKGEGLDPYWRRRKSQISFQDQLRSHEGGAEWIIWDLVKALLNNLPPEFWFTSRQHQRFVRSDLYACAKGFDPFNAALNHLYYHLKDRVMKALEAVGFSKFFPGPGLIHQRRRGYRPKNIEHRHNEEFIYDFMDSYRAPFRHALLHAFLNQLGGVHSKPEGMRRQQEVMATSLEEWLKIGVFTKQDFNWGFYERGSRGPRVYSPSEPTKERLDKLFELVWQQTYHYKGELRSLEEILKLEAQDFREFLYAMDAEGNVNRAVDPHTPFCALGDPVTTDWILDHYDILTTFFKYPLLPLDHRPACFQCGQRATTHHLCEKGNVICADCCAMFLETGLCDDETCTYYSSPPEVTIPAGKVLFLMRRDASPPDKHPPTRGEERYDSKLKGEPSKHPLDDPEEFKKFLDDWAKKSKQDPAVFAELYDKKWTFRQAAKSKAADLAPYIALEKGKALDVATELLIYCDMWVVSHEGREEGKD